MMAKTRAAAKKTTKRTAAKKAAKAKSGKKTAAKKAAKAKPAKKAAAKKATKAKPAKKTAAKKTAAKKTAKAKPGKKTAAKAKPAKKTAGKKAAKAKSAAKKVVAGVSAGEFAAQIAKIEARASAAGVRLPPGAREAQIVAAEEALGMRLPDEVRAWYRAHDGGSDDYALENRELLSLDRMVDEWKVWKQLLDDGVFAGNDHGEPGRGVQKKWWIPEWIPVTYDGSGNHHVIDLAPGPGGTRGQVLSFWHDDASRTVVGKGLLAWLARAEWGEGDD